MPSNPTVFLHPLANHSQDSYSAQQLPFKNLSPTSWPLVFLCVELWSMESVPLIQHFLCFLPFCLLSQQCLLPPSLVPSLSCLQRPSSVPSLLSLSLGILFPTTISPCPSLAHPSVGFHPGSVLLDQDQPLPPITRSCGAREATLLPCRFFLMVLSLSFPN